MPAPYLYMQCPLCQGQTVFPFPNLRESASHQPRLPKETWQTWFLCPHCEKVSLYKAGDVHLAKPQTWDPDPLSPRGAGSPPPFFYRVEHKCGHEGCGLPHVLFLKSWRYLTDKTVERKALSAMPRTRCAEGHEFGPSFEFVNVREVFSLL
jgi:hypothetical protein